MDLFFKFRDYSNVIIFNVKWKLGMKGKVMFYFIVLYLGDFELNKGDVVIVFNIDDDNWIEG